MKSCGKSEIFSTSPTWLLVIVGDDAADEVRLGGVQRVHQRVELHGVEAGHGLAAAALLLLPLLVALLLPPLAGVVAEAVDDQVVGARLHQLHHGVIQGVLVLLQPPGDVVGDGACVVDDGKVRILVCLKNGFAECGTFAQKIRLQFLFECLIRGLGEQGLLLEDGEDAEWLLEHGDTALEIHPEVHHLPVDAFLQIFFLLQHKHVVVEELLQFLPIKIDIRYVR